MATVEMQSITEWQRPLRDAGFYTAHSVEEALSLVNEHPEARFLAGGTSEVRFGRWGSDIPETLVYIGGIEELKTIEERDGRIAIGSLVVHNQLLASPLLNQKAAVLPLAAQEIAGPAVRNIATIGGNIFIDWDLVPVLLALDAQVTVQDADGERVIPLTDFHDQHGEPRIASNQLITTVSAAADLANYGYEKVARRKAVSRALIGTAVTMDVDGDVCRDVRIGIGGVGLSSRRLTSVEDLLRGESLTDELVTQAGQAAYDATHDAFEDFEASPWYTREMARVMTERAINSAAGRPVL